MSRLFEKKKSLRHRFCLFIAERRALTIRNTDYIQCRNVQTMTIGRIITFKRSERPRCRQVSLLIILPLRLTSRTYLDLRSRLVNESQGCELVHIHVYIMYDEKTDTYGTAALFNSQFLSRRFLICVCHKSHLVHASTLFSRFRHEQAQVDVFRPFLRDTSVSTFARSSRAF